jgi:hypothetical protein
MIMSVSTLVISSGAATPVSDVNLSIALILCPFSFEKRRGYDPQAQEFPYSERPPKAAF